MKRCVAIAWMVLTAAIPARAGESAAPDREQAAAALRRAVEFFDGTVSVEGGYLWRYAADLALREGEGKATASQAWTQPPGTPSVGMALLRSYEYTGEAYLLEAAR